jgi:hypothetical protein
VERGVSFGWRNRDKDSGGVAEIFWDKVRCIG